MTPPSKNTGSAPQLPFRARLRQIFLSYEGNPNLISSERSFAPPIGARVGPREAPRGYYIDLSVKASAPSWPPEWLQAPEQQLHVATVQWTLGAWERYVAGEGEEWRAAAIEGAAYLLETQQKEGRYRGGWLHWFPMPHTYRLDPPWTSSIAQGEAASLFVRLYAETGEERYAEAARLSLEPMRVPVKEGGDLAEIGDLPFFEEYPTLPPSMVLNGNIFALWGFHDVAHGLGDSEASDWFDAGVDGLAGILDRYDLGYWSRYDLHPHPIANVASPAYHLLHINQLGILHRLTGRPEFERMQQRFAGYRERRLNRYRSLATKVTFRLISPRNRSVARILPWARMPGGGGDVLVLCYHGVSDSWPSGLAVESDHLDEQIGRLVRSGYEPTTFTDAVLGPRDRDRFAVTFDDAYLSVLEKARPVLERHGVPGTVFVPTGLAGADGPMSWPGISEWVDTPHADELRPLSWEQLNELESAGWEVGAHSVTHARLTELSDEDLQRELRESRIACERQMRGSCTSIAYPFGDYDDRVIRAAALSGFAVGASLPPPYAEPSRLAWPRTGVYRVDSRGRFRLKASPVMRRLRRSFLGPLLTSLWRSTSRGSPAPS
jgi:heparosan-N-sulfate-glucuronate 5-epimerase